VRKPSMSTARRCTERQQPMYNVSACAYVAINKILADAGSRMWRLSMDSSTPRDTPSLCSNASTCRLFNCGGRVCKPSVVTVQESPGTAAVDVM
jgi:hypothetical protein